MKFFRYLLLLLSFTAIALGVYAEKYTSIVEDRAALYRVLALSGFVLIAGLWDWLLQFLKLGVAVRFLALATLALYGVMIISRPIGFFAYDYIYHIYYLRYVATHGALPSPLANFVTPHGPLYYVLAAQFFRFGKWIDYPHPEYVAGFFSLIVFLGYIAGGLLIVNDFVKSPRARFVASAFFLLAFPAVFPMPYKITNDGLVYAFMTWFLLNLFRWEKDRKSKYLVMSIWLLGGALAAKSTALFAVPILGLCILHALVFRYIRIHYLMRLSIVFACLGGLALASTNFGRLYLASKEDARLSMLNSIHKINPNPSRDPLSNIDNTFYEYIALDVPNLLSPPYWNAYVPGAGRSVYWNSFIKSLLYGEFNWGAPELAQYLMFSLMTLFLWAILCFIIYPVSENIRTLGACGAYTVVMLFASSMMFRFLYAHATSPNGRYILPITIIFAVLLGHALEVSRRNSLTMHMVGVIFIACVCCFSVVQYLGVCNVVNLLQTLLSP